MLFTHEELARMIQQREKGRHAALTLSKMPHLQMSCSRALVLMAMV